MTFTIVFPVIRLLKPRPRKNDQSIRKTESVLFGGPGQTEILPDDSHRLRLTLKDRACIVSESVARSCRHRGKIVAGFFLLHTQMQTFSYASHQALVPLAIEHGLMLDLEGHGLLPDDLNGLLGYRTFPDIPVPIIDPS